jgi:hypothetical protein
MDAEGVRITLGLGRPSPGAFEKILSTRNPRSSSEPCIAEACIAEACIVSEGSGEGVEASLPAEQPVASNKSTNIPTGTSRERLTTQPFPPLGPGTLWCRYKQEFAFARRRGVRTPARQRRATSGLGAPARAQPVQLASLEVVIQSSSSTGLPQYVSFIWGLAT